MKFNNSSNFFDGKNVAKILGNKLDSYDGSQLTGLKFTQLTDVGSPVGNKVLITNSTGSEINYLDVNFSSFKEINITNEDSDIITWSENICNVSHNMNGYVFTQVFDNDGDEIPLIKTHVDLNNILLYFDTKPQNNETYKLICVVFGYNLSNIDRSIIEINSPIINVFDFKNFLYNLIGDEVFSFNNEHEDKIVNFKLYLKMPQNLVKFTWPDNVEWKQEPNLSQANSLYIFSFEWNPIIKKWLGNQFW